MVRCLLLVVACLVAGPAVADILRVDGRQRDYILRLPPSHWPAPLIIVLHGGGGRAAQIESHIDFTEPALAAGFAVVYPQGFDRHWNDGRSDADSTAARQNIDDVKFILALVDRLAKAGQADTKRVYVVGISNGGMMALRLACQAADRVAGVASVVGSLAEDLASGCRPARPVPLLMLNGTADPLVPYEGGPVTALDEERGTLIAVEATLALFAKANGCGEATTTPLDDPAPRDEVAVERVDYAGCAAPTGLVRYVGGGHGWPGASQYLGKRLIGIVPEGPAANDLILDFLGALKP